MYKTCNGCKALISNRCELGYKIKSHSIKTSVGYDLIRCEPEEECPKPLTNSDYCKSISKINGK